MKHISPSQFSVFCCREKKQKSKLICGSKANAGIFCHIILLNHESRRPCLTGLALYEWPVLTWTWSSESLSSPRGPRGPGKPPGLSFSEWHCNAKQETDMQLEQVGEANKWQRQNLKVSAPSLCRWDSGSEIRSYMISVSSQWELGGISSTLPMWRPMGLLSVWMQRQCSSTPRLLRLIAVRREESHMVTKCNTECGQLLMHWGKERQ